MSPMKTLYRSLVPAIILLLAAACGDDPTPTSPQTPTATPGPTAAPTVAYFSTEGVTPVPTRPRPTATPTPEPTGPADAVVYDLARISTPACRYELRMGETIAWGYGGPEDGDQRIQAGADPDDGRDYKHVGGIEIGPLNVGDTLQFGRFENPTRICLETVSLVNEELGVNATLAPEERIEPFEIVITKAGRFVLDDPAKPGERGSFVIVVNE